MASWGLQAVIRPANEYHDNDDVHDHNMHAHDNGEDDGFGIGLIDKQEYDEAADLLFCFPHLFHHHRHSTTMETTTDLHLDDHQLYNPLIYPTHHQIDDHHHFHPPPPPPPSAADQQIINQQQDIKTNISDHQQLVPKLKKRKNQQKRVVVEATADGLCSDPWAWRKYGQKPIKGSIYPRSYYRCSSSKGCMARRQVEQSCTDPSIYILTYTADHNHPQPTRRNSLAGINRNRFNRNTPTISNASKALTRAKHQHSPTTPSVSSTDDELLQQPKIKLDSMYYRKLHDQEHNILEGINDDHYMVFSDDFFEGLEDLGGNKMELSSSSCTNKQFPDVFC